MTFEEKATWITGTVSLVAYAVYVLVILGRAQTMPVAEVPYVTPMLWTIGATAVGSIVAVIVASIVGAIVAEVTSQRFDDTTDERDKQISRKGEFIGFYVFGFGILAVLGITMVEADHFWIANAIFLLCFVSTTVSSVVKIATYRRGF